MTLPVLALAGVVAASSALLLILAGRLTFFQDSWAFLMHRQGSSLDDLLSPHNEHIVVIPVVLQKLLLALFGMTSAMPEFVVLTAALVLTAAFLFVYVRRRLGPWPALFAAALVLFLGPASQVLLWPFEIALVGSTMTGVAMFLALEREDRAGDLAASLLLVLSIGFSSLGLAFAVGAAVDVFQHRRSRGVARAYLVCVPLVLYGAWYVGWGREAQSSFSLGNIPEIPVYVVEGIAASLAAVTGLSALTDSVEQRPWAGLALLAALLVAIGWGLWRGRRSIPTRFWPVAATAAAFWVLGALNQGPGREAEASRYLHFGAVVLLMVAADLLDGVRFVPRALLVGGAVVLAICAVNLRPLDQGYDQFREQTVLTRSDLAAMDIAERTIDPGFSLSPEIAGTPSLIDVNAAEYLAAKERYGTPAYSPAELTEAPAAGRRQADIVLAQALPISTVVELGSDVAKGACAELRAGPDGALPEVELGPGVTRIALAPGPEASLSLRRFAIGEHPVATHGTPGDSVTALRIPRDWAPQPWFLAVEAEQPVRICH